MGIHDVPPQVFRGLRLILLGFTVLFLSYKYDKYLETNKCPHCGQDTPDEADICPACYKSLLQFEGITCRQTISVAFTIFVLMIVAIFVLLPIEL